MTRLSPDGASPKELLATINSMLNEATQLGAMFESKDSSEIEQRDYLIRNMQAVLDLLGVKVDIELEDSWYHLKKIKVPQFIKDGKIITYNS